MAKKYVIIGGVAGGATAAARLRRIDEFAEITMIERGFDVSFANCGLPYHIGGEIPLRESLLVQTKAGLEQKFALKILTRTEAIAIDKTKKTVQIKNLESGEISTLSYDKLLLSPGALPIVPPLAGIPHNNIMTLRDMSDMDRIKKVVDGRVKTATIIGAGFIGLELAENLHHKGIKVHIVDLAPQVLAPFDAEIANVLKKELLDHQINVHLNTSVKEFQHHNDQVTSILANGTNLVSDIVILSIGVKPDTKIASLCNLELTPNGSIIVDSFMQTSDPNIFAVGDAVQIKHKVLNTNANIPLAAPANRQARLAADNMTGAELPYHGAIGTSILRVFKYTAALTGASEKLLQRNQVEYDKIFIHRDHHVGYFPGAKKISLKLLFSKKDGKILGAQAVGEAGVDKRIDIIATAINNQLTVDDLTELELAYAPPFGAAKDPVNIAGYVASNAFHKREDFIDPPTLMKGNYFIVDVREPDEFASGHIEGAKNIPLSTMRQHLNEFPKDLIIALYCAVGQRAYYATRILRQHNIKCVNIMGGYTTYQHYRI